MKIIISHVYSSENKGDAALTSVLIEELVKQYRGAQLTILTMNSLEADSLFEKVPQQPSFMCLALHRYRQPLAKLLYMLYMLPATLLWAWWRKLTGKELFLPVELRRVAAVYAQADLIVPVGGGYLRSRSGVMNRCNIPLLLHPLLLGYILGRPTILYAQSVGPFMHGYEGRLAAWVLRKMTKVIVREDVSAKLLDDLGVRRNVVRGIDAGFLFKSSHRSDVRAEYGIAADTLLIGVTVRSWLSGKAQEQYEISVAKALDQVIRDHKAHVIFIPQVTAANGDDDRLSSLRVHARMKKRECATVIMGAPNHKAIKALYGQFDVLLGTRFHSVIFSLTAYVPVVAIEYEHKTSGIMQDLGLNDWVVHIEKVKAASLTRLLEKAIRGRRQYRRQLQEVLPPYIAKAEETNKLLGGYAITE